MSLHHSSSVLDLIDREVVPPVLLSKLIPVIPSVFALLKENDPQAADQLLVGDDPDVYVVNGLMKELLGTLAANGDLTYRELRLSFASYKPSVWLGMVRTVFTECWPRLIPEKVGQDLIGLLTDLSEAADPVSMAHVLGPTLDRIPRSRYTVVAEFCAFIRDTSHHREELSCLIGPFLLMPARLPTTEGTARVASMTAASAAIMDILVQEAELLFGRAAVPSPYGYPLGIRPKEAKGGGRFRTSLKNGLKRLSLRSGGSSGSADSAGDDSGFPSEAPATPPRGRKGRAHGSSPLGEKRKRQLRVFYQWRDPRRTRRVDILFENYSFEQIALAIQRKYFMLPPKWKEQLEYLLLMGNSNLEWFARLKEGVLPAPIQDDQGHFLAVGSIDEDTVPETKIDRVVNELAETELTFNRSINDLLAVYVNRLRVITEGMPSSTAQRVLGLSPDAIEHIFGTRLERVADVSSNMLADLEVVTLLRVAPKTGISRIELVSRVFVEIAQQLYVFSPYAVNHSTAAKLLREARNSLPESNGRPIRRMGSILQGSDRNKNFLEIWEDVSSQSDALRGQTLESILIMPIQRVPRYKLLLEELLKATSQEDECYGMLQESVEVVREVANTINESIRKHERVMKLVGEDPNLPDSFRRINIR